MSLSLPLASSSQAQNTVPLSEIPLSKTVPPAASSSSTLNKKEKIQNIFFEITIPSNVPDNFQLAFQNYYTSMIVILQESKVLLEKYKLMEYAHNEAEAFLWHTIPGSVLINKGLQKGKPLKFYLFQSTDMWNKIDLKNFRVIFQRNESNSPRPDQSTSQQSSLSSFIINDFKILTEAARIQSSMKLPPDSFYAPADEITKRSTRRKEKRTRKSLSASTDTGSNLP